jgi:hypothetical protein
LFEKLSENLSKNVSENLPKCVFCSKLMQNVL